MKLVEKILDGLRLLFIPDPKTGGYREGFLESGAEIADIGAEDADLTKKLVVAVGRYLQIPQR